MKEFFIVPVVNELLSDKPNHSWHWNHIPNAGCLSTAFRRMSIYRFHRRRPFGQGSTPTNPKKGVEHLFESVTPLFRSVDATVINLECPITSVRSPLHKKYIFRAEPIWATVLSQAGITHAATANNHTIDQGRNGLTDTNQYLLSSGITPVGYGDASPQSCQPVLIKKGKIEVALYNSVALPLENWVYLENSPGICQQPIEELKEEITNFKRQNPKSYIVVILHWGVEYQPLPTLVQRKGAHSLIRAGADAIIGHHPHIIQKRNITMANQSFTVWGISYSTSTNRKLRKV